MCKESSMCEVNDTATATTGKPVSGIAAWLAGDRDALRHLQQPHPDEWLGTGERGQDSERGQRADVARHSRGAAEAGGVGDDNFTRNEDTHCDTHEGPVGPQFYVRRCGCNSWFCSDCCEHKGIKIREQIKPILNTYRGVLMLTLTTNPQAFDGNAETAFRYVRDNRCIAYLIRELKRRGLLYSERWFRVVEWHKNGFAHYHVLLDADYVPQQTVHDIWQSYAPAGYKGFVSENGYRNRLGWVSLNKKPFAGAEHAANYATKYLIKQPKHPFPEWVMEFDGRIRRHEKSRNFNATDDVENSTQNDTYDEADSTEKSIGEQMADLGKANDEAKPQRTIKEILASCGRDAKLMQYEEFENDDGEIISKWTWRSTLKNGWQEMLRIFAEYDDQKDRKFLVSPDQEQMIFNLFGVYPSPNRQTASPSPSTPNPYHAHAPTPTSESEATTTGTAELSNEAEQLYQAYAAWRADHGVCFCEGCRDHTKAQPPPAAV